MSCKDSCSLSLFSGLNQEQNSAVSADPQRHILVLAGAGCGKTTVLTRRVAYLIATGIDQKKILALTFTRKAAMEMESRVCSLDRLENSNKMPLITTFHGFALRILSEDIEGKVNFQRIGYNATPVLMEEKERIELLVHLCTIQERKSFHTDIFGIDALLAQKAVFPEKLSVFDTEMLLLLDEIEGRLKREKLKAGKWDFSNLLSGVLELFDGYPEIAHKYADRFEAVLVDEFQDTNPGQIKLLHKILADKNHLFAVGDDDQAIYGFRGADIRPTIEFRSFFPGAAILKLQVNYRSVPSILNTANKLFADKDPLYRKILVSGKYDQAGKKPSFHLFEDQFKMIDWVMKQAFVFSTRDGISLDKMVMLFRVNQSLEWSREIVNKKYEDKKNIQFLTVHGSKGLEFPVVFLCDLEEGIFPNYQLPVRKKINSILELISFLFHRDHKDIVCDWNEELRLFYVGITRAQKHLFFLSVRNKYIYGRKRSMVISRLLRLV